MTLETFVVGDRTKMDMFLAPTSYSFCLILWRGEFSENDREQAQTSTSYNLWPMHEQQDHMWQQHDERIEGSLRRFEWHLDIIAAAMQSRACEESLSHPKKENATTILRMMRISESKSTMNFLMICLMLQERK